MLGVCTGRAISSESLVRLAPLSRLTLLLGEILCVLEGRDDSVDGEEGSEVGGVGGDDDEGEEPPDAAHDPRGGRLGVQPRSLPQERSGDEPEGVRHRKLPRRRVADSF